MKSYYFNNMINFVIYDTKNTALGTEWLVLKLTYLDRRTDHHKDVHYSKSAQCFIQYKGR